jgi:perosamine synthetase
MIPVSKPIIESEDVRLVTDAVSSGWVSSQGAYIERFEREFAAFCGVKHCVATSNGTVAIHLALKVLDIGKGDEVIVPDLTFVATANAVVLAEATPVIADVRRSDWCIDPESVKRLITPRTRAIIPVHLYGHPAAMDELRALARQHGLKIIEDAAEAHGAEYRGRKVGALGDCATFSFYGNKIITTGEGGALTTDSDAIAQRARFLRDHAMSKEKRYWHTEVGYNYRMTNLQAALGVAQLGRIDSFVAERARILESYRHHLAPHGVTLNPHLDGARPVNWITCVLLDGVTREERDAVMVRLHEQGVDSRPFFYPLSALPMYERAPGPVSADLSARGMNLPTFPGLSEDDIERICRALLSSIRKR